MRLTDVQIQGFRSIEDVRLAEIGALNVLIGKNNSGKSTILSSIDTFFSCIRDGKIVSINPQIGRSIDFHRQPAATTINVTLVFTLGHDEAASLQQDMALAAPQLRAVTNGLTTKTSIRVNLAITSRPSRFSCINHIELISVENPEQNVRKLLKISPTAAAELADRQHTIRSLTETVDNLERFLHTFDEDDFKRAKQEGDSRANALRYNYSRVRYLGEGATQAWPIIENLLKASGGYVEFRSNMNSYRAQVAEDIKKAEQEPIRNNIETFSGEQQSIPDYAMSLVRKISEIKLLYLTERREPVGRAEATQLLQYKVTRGGTETLREIQKTIDNLLGVQLDAFESTQSGKSERIAEMDVDNFLLEVNGSGIKEALRLVLDVEFQKPEILLVEEPEVHLHPALETNMMRYLRSKSDTCQLFLSTHSTNFLDSSEMKNVYFVSKPNAKTEVQLMNIAEAEETLPKELGIRLSSLFMFDRIVFVEGPTDEAMFREFANLLGVNLSYANVGFIHLGGVRNFTHYATETIFNFLTKRQVKIWFILDRDERNDQDLNSMNQRLAGKASIKVLEKRELENYLVMTRPLTEFINWKLKGIKGNAEKVDETSVAEATGEAVEKLKVLAIAKRASKAICKSIHPSIDWAAEESVVTVGEKIRAELNRLLGDVQAAVGETDRSIEQAVAAVETDWARSKLSIVPGDILIDAICRKFGVRFKKVSDSARLTAMLHVEEIDAELSKIIRELVA